MAGLNRNRWQVSSEYALNIFKVLYVEKKLVGVVKNRHNKIVKKFRDKDKAIDYLISHSVFVIPEKDNDNKLLFRIISNEKSPEYFDQIINEIKYLNYFTGSPLFDYPYSKFIDKKSGYEIVMDIDYSSKVKKDIEKLSAKYQRLEKLLGKDNEILQGLSRWGIEHTNEGISIFSIFKDIPDSKELVIDKQGSVFRMNDNKKNRIEYGYLAIKMTQRLFESYKRNIMGLMLAMERGGVIRINLNVGQTKVFTGKRMYYEFKNNPDGEVIYRNPVTHSHIYMDDESFYLVILINGLKIINEHIDLVKKIINDAINNTRINKN